MPTPRRTPHTKVTGGRVHGALGVAVEPRSTAPVIECAGSLIWREKEGNLQVLLIHRPRYDDWSWPKGKRDPGEALPCTAVREVKEETGRDIVLGIPLPGLQYITPEGDLKRVHYWAGRTVKKGNGALAARAPVGEVDNREVDESAWFPLKEAYKKLTRAADQTPLRALELAHTEGRLDSHVVAIARHGKALARSAWFGTEGDRPLTPLGFGQSWALVPVLSAFGVTSVVTSRWARCTLTMRPYEEAARVKAKELDSLTEASHERDPESVVNAVRELLEHEEPAVLCSHRPVLPTLFAAMGKASADKKIAAAFPHKDPYLGTGEVLIAHVANNFPQDDSPKPIRVLRTTGARIVGIERVRPDVT